MPSRITRNSLSVRIGCVLEKFLCQVDSVETLVISVFGVRDEHGLANNKNPSSGKLSVVRRTNLQDLLLWVFNRLHRAYLPDEGEHVGKPLLLHLPSVMLHWALSQWLLCAPRG